MALDATMMTKDEEMNGFGSEDWVDEEQYQLPLETANHSSTTEKLE